MLKELVLHAKHKLGLLSKDEIIATFLPERERIIDKLPRADAEEVRRIANSFNEIQNVADVSAFYSITKQLQRSFETVAFRNGFDKDQDNVSKSMASITQLDSLGYRPSQAQAWGFFPNVWSMYAWFAENHWAIRAARDIIITEVDDDGFDLQPLGDMPSSARRREIWNILEYYGIPEMRTNLIDQGAVFANSWVLPKKNMMGGKFPNELELMPPPRVQPIYDMAYDKIVGWDYRTGYVNMAYKLTDIRHLKWRPYFNMPQLGCPSLQPMIVDLESDKNFSHLNNEVAYKAGIIGLIIALAEPAAKNPLNLKTSEKVKDKLVAEIKNAFSGIKGGQSILVSNYIENVFKVSNIGDLDANFQKFRLEIAKAVCILLNVPPEKISISRTQTQQYHSAMFEDAVNAAFDKAIRFRTRHTDMFINRIMKYDLGITDVELIANGRFGSLTLNAARAAKIASETWGIFTLNQMLSLFYGLRPLPPEDARGMEIVDNSKNRDPDSTEVKIAVPDPRDTPGERNGKKELAKPIRGKK